jgi:hypothetical protein
MKWGPLIEAYPGYRGLPPAYAISALYFRENYDQ